jgi:chromosome partitioning protein
MILTVGNTKGGVGKTCLALNIAIARALSGRDVWLIDGDRQGTAQTAISIRSDNGHKPGIACASYPDGKTLRSQIQNQGDKWDDVIIDVGGRDSTALRAALLISDVLLTPFLPRSFDVWALNDIATLIDQAREDQEARGLQFDLRAYAILNCADPGDASTDNSEAVEALVDVPQFEYLATPIRRRKSFANAAGQGLSVLELKPGDKKAKDELITLIDALF